MDKIEMHAVSEIRELRKARREAIYEFVEKLGFDPMNIRGIEIRHDRIVVRQFVETAPMPDGLRPITEVELLFTDTPDLDEAQAFQDFVEGMPTQP